MPPKALNSAKQRELDQTPIEIGCQIRTIREKTIAVWDGRFCDGKEHWLWLPRSQIRWWRPNHADAENSMHVIVCMPMWLAEDRGMAVKQIPGSGNLRRAAGV